MIDVLNHALASELVSWLTYTAHATAAQGLREDVVSREFLSHATQELEHAQALIRRIDELGGVPELNPDSFNGNALHVFTPAGPLREMLVHQLAAERAAVEFYREQIQWLSDRDPTTRRVLEDILAVEERHANDLQGFVDR